MHRCTIFIAASACLATAPVVAQAQSDSTDRIINSEAGKGEIFMDKRSPEERDTCANGFASSGGNPKIFKDDRSASAEKGGTAKRDGDAFAQSGGNPKIFKDEQCANDVVKGGGGSDI